MKTKWNLLVVFALLALLAGMNASPVKAEVGPVISPTAHQPGGMGSRAYTLALETVTPTITVGTSAGIYWGHPFNIYATAYAAPFFIDGVVDFAIDDKPVEGCQDLSNVGNVGAEFFCGDISLALDAGEHTLAASFTPADPVSYNSASGSGTFTVLAGSYSIQGIVFRDDNKDKVWDYEAEYGVGGWTLNLTTCAGDPVMGTDGNVIGPNLSYDGWFTFYYVPGGQCVRLSEEVQTGWQPTTPTYVEYTLSASVFKAEFGNYYPHITVSPTDWELPDGEVGIPYTQEFSAAGGQEPYAYTLTSYYRLPDGLALSADGTLSGTPTLAGDFYIDVQAEDANQAVGSQSYELIVTTDGTFTLSSSSNPSAPGDEVTFTLSGSGTAYDSWMDQMEPPYGLVTFQADGVDILGCSDLYLSYEDEDGYVHNQPAVCKTSALGLGNHAITASYTGWSEYFHDATKTLEQKVSSIIVTTSFMLPEPSLAGYPIVRTYIYFKGPGVQSDYACTVDYGDGTVQTGRVEARPPDEFICSDEITTNHVYQNAGSYDITFNIKNPGSGDEIAPAIYHEVIADTDPGYITWSPDPVVKDQPVTFSASQTADQYAWYLVSGPGIETPTAVGADQSFTYTFSSSGTYKVMLVLMDVNIETNAIDGIADGVEVIVDTTPPVVGTFSVPSPSTSLDIPITAFTASDDTGVTGYLVTTTGTPPLSTLSGWGATAPTSFHVEGSGLYSLYPWAKDAAGNVSAVYGTPVSVRVCSSAAITVTSYLDGGAGSLRQAIIDICPGGTIDFDGNKYITLDSPLPHLDRDMTISGTGHTVRVNGGNHYRLFYVDYGVSVNMNDLTLWQGHASDGGAIYSEGTLALSNILFWSNRASSSGGAIYSYNSIYSPVAGSLSLTGCSFYNNSAMEKGGGIYYTGKRLSITQTDLVQNSALGNGGGIYFGGGNLFVTESNFTSNSALNGGGILANNSALHPNINTKITESLFKDNFTATGGQGGGILNSLGTMAVANSSLTGNSASKGGGITNDGTLNLYSDTFWQNTASGSTENGGGGVYNYRDMNFTNTIIAGSSGIGGDCYNDEGNIGTIGLNRNNLVQDGSCNHSDTATVIGFLSGDPKLGSLQDNGGPTWTIPLLEGSLAIDGGDDLYCSSGLVDNLDQRGVTRPQGAHCDIGAFEKELAVVTLSDLEYFYDGQAKFATVTTLPTGLTVDVTYNGSTDLPVNAGDYTVVATIIDVKYMGSATGTLTILPTADLSLTKADNKDPVKPGASLVYTLTVTNLGPYAAQSVSVVDTLDRNTSYATFSAPKGWRCQYASGKVTCTRAELASGSSAILKITVTVSRNARLGKDLVNHATVSSLTYDPVLTNNSVVQKTLVSK